MQVTEGLLGIGRKALYFTRIISVLNPAYGTGRVCWVSDGQCDFLRGAFPSSTQPTERGGFVGYRTESVLLYTDYIRPQPNQGT
jgi:hypothetical protein